MVKPDILVHIVPASQRKGQIHKHEILQELQKLKRYFMVVATLILEKRLSLYRSCVDAT